MAQNTELYWQTKIINYSSHFSISVLISIFCYNSILLCHFLDQRNLGMSMRVERSSLDQVKKRFELNKKKLEEKRKDYDIESRVKELKEEEDKLKEYRKEQKRAKKRLHDDISKSESESGNQDELSAIMGFSGFGSSKK